MTSESVTSESVIVGTVVVGVVVVGAVIAGTWNLADRVSSSLSLSRFAGCLAQPLG